MNQIVVDGATRAKLNAARRSELCDSSGELIGYFVSPEWYFLMHEAWEKAAPAERAELEIISKETGGRPLNTILANLGVQ